MSFSDAVKTCFGKYVTFSGRASRPEYWYFFLFVMLVMLVSGTLDQALFGTSAADLPADADPDMQSQPISSLAGLVLFLPHFAAAWRRMHDTGRSGLFVFLPSLVSLVAALIAVFGLGLADMASGTLDSVLTSATLLILIPLMIIGLLSPLIVLWWLTRPSQPGPNAYGDNSHEVST